MQAHGPESLRMEGAESGDSGRENPREISNCGGGSAGPGCASVELRARAQTRGKVGVAGAVPPLEPRSMDLTGKRSNQRS
ncbi:hypothetical protein NDU88_003312 [Pleurodeles waltl]|uniref:Uncharacterized protein n=1 Tax=Pleurodeles waltl TaxID=8319 RepID=A0AAV7W214_PLEWA|nr:hypothetical protein NDU88_003312 [Pleurodeles waltl]